MLVQFVQKGNQKAELVGFSGILDSKTYLAVDHLYLHDGRKMEVTKGNCRFTYARRDRLASILCGARVERDDVAVASVIAFDLR